MKAYRHMRFVAKRQPSRIVNLHLPLERIVALQISSGGKRVRAYRYSKTFGIDTGTPSEARHGLLAERS